MERQADVRIVCYTNRFGDFTSFCRLAGPLNRLMRDGHPITAEYREKPDNDEWVYMQRANVVFVQHPNTPESLELCRLAKASSLPLVVDLDDNYFQVPQYNNTHWHYSSPKTIEVVKKSIALADAVIVSTEALAEVYKPYAKCPIHVIQNGYDSKLFQYYTDLTEKRSKCVLIRGSQTHDGDVLPVAKEIADAVSEAPDWKLHCFGYVPWMIAQHFPNADKWSASIYPMMAYYRTIWAMSPSVMVVPLADNLFNQGKSNAAAVEGAMIGAQVVAPEYLPEFANMPGVITYNETPGSMKHALTQAIEGSETAFASERVSMMRKYIQDHLELGYLNEFRMEVFRGIVK